MFKWTLRILGWLVTTAVTLVMAAAGVSPQDAESNLAAWAINFDLNKVAQFLPPGIDKLVLVAGGVFLALVANHYLWKGVACFLDKKAANPNGGTRPTNRREIRENLAGFLRSGQPLLASASNPNHPVPEGEFAEWIDKIEKDLRKNLDESYAVRLRDRTGVSVVSYRSFDAARRQIHADIQLTLERLREFLRELHD